VRGPDIHIRILVKDCEVAAKVVNSKHGSSTFLDTPSRTYYV